MKITQILLPLYGTERTEGIYLGVNHSVNLSKWKNTDTGKTYEEDPYNQEGLINLFTVGGRRNSFSCHFLILRDGTVIQFVDIKFTAWHAGKSVIATPLYNKYLNKFSVGVEYAGGLNDGFTDRQYKAGAKLSAHIENEVVKHRLGKITQWVGHDWISGEIAVRLGIKDRSKIKTDPGTAFDWLKFNTLLWAEKLKAADPVQKFSLKKAIRKIIARIS